MLTCLCALCHHRWTAATLGDCPRCGGTARLAPPPCTHARLSGRPGDVARTCLDCGALRIGGRG